MKQFFFALFILMVFPCFLFAQSDHEENARKYIEKSKTLYTQNLDSSLSYAIKAIEIAKESKNSSIIAQAYSNQGICYWYAAKFDSARIQFEKAADLFRDSGDSLRLAKTMGNIGLLHNNQGNLSKAFSAFTESHKIFEEYRDSAAIINSNINIGLIYLDFDLMDFAEKCFLENLELINEDSANNRWTVSLNNLGLVYNKKKEKQQAEECFKEALKLAKKQRSYFDAGHSYLHLANLYTDNKDYPNAIRAFDSAMDNYERTNYPIGLLEAQLLKAQMCQLKGDFNAAKSIMDKLEDKINRLNDFRLHFQLIKNKAKQAEWEKNYQKAFSLIKTREEFQDSLTQLETKNRISFYQVLYETEKKENVITNLKIQQELIEKENSYKNYVIGSISGASILAIVALLFFFNSRNKKRQRDHLRNQIAGQEELRGLISGQLHDKVCSEILGLQIKFNQFAESKDTNKEEINDTIKQIYRETRTISKELQSPDWSRVEISSFINKISDASGLNAHLSVKTQFENVSNWFKLNHASKTGLHLIMHEIFTNIIKHANANEVFIKGSSEQGKLQFVISDNGIGMGPIDNKGGISNIRKRISSLKGHFEIKSKESEGTSIYITIPVHEQT